MTTILSISLPEELRAALDAASARERRSRSFVVAEAVRAYLAHQERQAFDDARTRTLREGLALTPAARLRLAEELWQEFAHGRKLAKPFSASFDTFGEYEEWRRRGGERGS
jgi:predicted transcriptional regulator